MPEAAVMQLLPEWLRIVLVVLAALKGPTAMKMGYEKVQKLRGKNSGNGHSSSVTYAIEEHVVPQLTALNAGIAEMNRQMVRNDALSQRIGDIQIATSRNLNEYQKVMAILCDRMRIDRPDVIKLPESHNTPFSLED